MLSSMRALEPSKPNRFCPAGLVEMDRGLALGQPSS
jgi:hypothetical protein